MEGNRYKNNLVGLAKCVNFHQTSKNLISWSRKLILYYLITHDPECQFAEYEDSQANPSNFRNCIVLQEKYFFDFFDFGSIFARVPAYKLG